MNAQLTRFRVMTGELRVAMRKPLANLSKPWWYLICAGVFLFALALRVAHSRAGLPYIEGDIEVYSTSLYMNRRQSLDPEIFDIPSLAYTLGYLVNTAVSLVSSAFGTAIPAENLAWNLEGWSSTLSNPDFLLVNRLVLSIIGAATCLLTLLIAEQLVGRTAGLISGVVLAVNPFMVAIDSRYSPNGLTAFFFTAAIFFALHFFANGKFIYLITSLASVGLATGSKYTGALSIIAPLIAVLARRKKSPSIAVSAYVAVFLVFPALFFIVSTPYFLARPGQLIEAVLNQRRHYFEVGHYGADIEPGLNHLLAMGSEFQESFGIWLLVIAAIGLLFLAITNFKASMVLIVPQALYLVMFAMSSVKGHSNHAANYPLVAVGVGAGVSFFVGLWLIARQRRWRGSQLLAIPMVAVFVPVGLAVAGGFQQLVTDWRYQDPRVMAVDALATGEYGGNVVFATELRVHPAERERLVGVANPQVLPLDQIVRCDLPPDATLVLPTSVTTWREAAARRMGELKPPNELNSSLQQLLVDVTPAANFGTNETVLDYNFTDPELIIIKATDIPACA